MTDAVLQQACRDVVSRLQKPRTFLNLPDIGHVQKAVSSMAMADLIDNVRSDVKTLNSIAQTVWEMLKNGKDLSKKQLRQAIWCLWETKPALAEDDGVLRRLLDLIVSSGKRRLFKALSTVYLSQFRNDRPGLSIISSTLQAAASSFGFPWNEFQQNFALYDIVNGPDRIAQMALTQEKAATEVMREIGLSALSAQSGFAEAITKSILRRIAKDTTRSHGRRLELIKLFALDQKGSQLFPSLDIDIAEALVRPVIAAGGTPDDSIKDPILDILIRLFDDPRLKSGRWEKMAEIKDVVISWLTKQSLRQFLDIVDRITTEPTEKDMWKYRRAFWEAIYENGLIKGAWVVFADDGVNETRRFFGDEVKFGRFRRGGTKQTRSSHAVLLLQIGRGIVSDWSHNGKVNVWSSAEDTTAPKLYKPWYKSNEVQYSKADLKTKNHLVKTHSSPKTYSWQDAVAQRIYEMTNTRIHKSKYKV